MSEELLNVTNEFCRDIQNFIEASQSLEEPTKSGLTMKTLKNSFEGLRGIKTEGR